LQVIRSATGVLQYKLKQKGSSTLGAEAIRQSKKAVAGISRRPCSFPENIT